jgi:RNA polymerase sigma-70 factor (ECF subfamily)
MTGEWTGQSTDESLVEAIAGGSHDALALLYDRHADAVFATASRMTSDRQVAEEVVQETFLALWNRADRFDRAAGSLAAWLHTIARNRTVDRLRAAGRRPNLFPLSAAAGEGEDETGALERLAASGTVVGGAATGLGPESSLEAGELRDMLRSALADMPEAERTVIVLAYREDLSQSEIADRLSWPIGTVKTRTRRALRRLREVLAVELGPAAGIDEVPAPTGEER